MADPDRQRRTLEGIAIGAGCLGVLWVALHVIAAISLALD